VSDVQSAGVVDQDIARLLDWAADDDPGPPRRDVRGMLDESMSPLGHSNQADCVAIMDQINKRLSRSKFAVKRFPFDSENKTVLRRQAVEGISVDFAGFQQFKLAH